MSALRMPTVKQDPENQPTEVVGRSCYAGEEDMKVSSPKLNNLILANLLVGHFESGTLSNRKPAVPVLRGSSNSQLLPARHSPILPKLYLATLR